MGAEVLACCVGAVSLRDVGDQEFITRLCHDYATMLGPHGAADYDCPPDERATQTMRAMQAKTGHCGM